NLEAVLQAVARGPDEAGRREREAPRGEHADRDAPADLGAGHADARAEDRAGGDVRRRQRVAEEAGHEDDGRGRRLGGHALARVDLDEALAEGADDAPAAEVRAEGHG